MHQLNNQKMKKRNKFDNILIIAAKRKVSTLIAFQISLYEKYHHLIFINDFFYGHRKI